MTSTFYRILACLGLVAGLSACNRATYSFTSQPAYSAALVAVPTSVADQPPALAEIAAGPTPGTGLEAVRPVRHTRHRPLKPHIQQLTEFTDASATAPAAAALPPLRGRKAARRHQNTAASGALVPDSAVSGLGQLAIIIAVLFCVAVGAVILLLSKATAHVVESKSRQPTAPVAPRATP